MSGRLIAPCSLTRMLTGDKGSAHGYVIDFPEPLASIVHKCKVTIQQLQLEILSMDDLDDDLEKIGRRFEKLEVAIDTLLEYSAKKPSITNKKDFSGPVSKDNAVS